MPSHNTQSQDSRLLRAATQSCCRRPDFQGVRPFGSVVRGLGLGLKPEIADKLTGGTCLPMSRPGPTVEFDTEPAQAAAPSCPAPQEAGQ